MEKSKNFTTFEVFAKNVKGEKDGKKYDFYAYHTYNKDAKKVTVKFTKMVKNAPTERCYVRVQNTEWNLDKTSRFPTIWIKEIEETLPITKQNKAVDDFEDLDALPF